MSVSLISREYNLLLLYCVADIAKSSRPLGEVDYQSKNMYQHAPSLLLGFRLQHEEEKPRRRPRCGRPTALQAMSSETRKMPTNDERYS